ncbi:MAG: hypothetical protein KGO92_05370 [Bacteroidota bacterium]|nr:hypothetical protein [Bacteroidota bacterium]
MKMHKYLLLLLGSVSFHLLHAQKTIVWEELRCFDNNNSLTADLRQAELGKLIASQLNQTLEKKYGLTLSDTNSINLNFLDYNRIPPPVKPNFKDADTNHLHLYMDFLEVMPYRFFLNEENLPRDTTLPKRAKTVFVMESWIITADKRIVQHEALSIVVSEALNTGIGTLYHNGIQFSELSVLPKTFAEFFRTASGMVLDPDNKLSLVEIQLAPAYWADNYIMPVLGNYPRILVTNQNGFSSYSLQHKKELIRMEDPVYEEILLKGKNTPDYPESLTQAIRNADHFSRSDFVFLKQDARDVLRDRNYQIKLVSQIDPQNVPEDRNLLFTGFLPGPYHLLLRGKDTLAVFSIETNIREAGRKYFSKIYNGIDSETLQPVANNPSEWPVQTNYLVSGTLQQQPFQIKCTSGNTLKEVYLNKKMVAVIQGKFRPDKFVLFDASLSPELVNSLLILSCNRFFE